MGESHCADLSPQYWISNQAHSGSLSSSPNSFEFQMPDLRALSCSNDFLGGFPEFQFRIRTEGDCHRGTWGAFKLLQKEDTGSQTFSLNVPAQYELGGASAGLRVSCANCYASGTGGVHVLVRTTNYNPFDETWSWGSLNLRGNVDVEAEAYVSASRTLDPVQVLSLGCVPGLCIGAKVASIDVFLGVLADLWVGAEGTFDATAILTYQRNMDISGTFAHHTRQGATIQNVLSGFDPSAQQGSPATPQVRLDIDANALVRVIPRIYTGVFVSLSTSAEAEAYIKIEAQLALRAYFNFRTAIATINYLTAIDHTTQCTTALIGCSSQCSANHDVHLGFQLSAVVYGAYKFYIQTTFPLFGSVNFGSSQEIALSPSPHFSYSKWIGSFCYYLFPPSPSPPPPSPSPPPPHPSPPPRPPSPSPPPPFSISTPPTGECTCAQLTAFISNGVGTNLCSTARAGCTNLFSVWQCSMSSTDGEISYTVNCVASSSSSGGTTGSTTDPSSGGSSSSNSGTSGNPAESSTCQAPVGSFCCDDDPINPNYVCSAGTSCGRGICVPARSTLCGCSGQHYCAAGTTCCGNTCCTTTSFCGGDEASCTCSSDAFPLPRNELMCGPTVMSDCNLGSSLQAPDSGVPTGMIIGAAGGCVALIAAVVLGRQFMKKRAQTSHAVTISQPHQVELPTPHNNQKDAGLSI